MYWLDLFGTFAFAVSGAMLGVRCHLDLLGALVLATLTGVGGGIIRDALLGVTPPGAIHDETYLLVCLAGGVLSMAYSHAVKRYWKHVMVADAIGLAVFTVIGASQAEQHGLGPFGIVIMATITATGGGAIRDLFVTHVPVIVRKDFYATAAILGGLCWWTMLEFSAPEEAKIVVSLALTLGLRLWAMVNKIRLPRLGFRKN